MRPSCGGVDGGRSRRSLHRRMHPAPSSPPRTGRVVVARARTLARGVKWKFIPQASSASLLVTLTQWDGEPEKAGPTVVVSGILGHVEIVDGALRPQGRRLRRAMHDLNPRIRAGRRAGGKRAAPIDFNIASCVEAAGRSSSRRRPLRGRRVGVPRASAMPCQVRAKRILKIHI